MEKVFEKARVVKLLRWPGPMKTPLEQRDPRWRCEFHRDHGHETKNCFNLKEQIEELMRNRQLQNSVCGGSNMKVQLGGNDKQEVKGPSSDDEEPTNYIISELTGDSGGCSPSLDVCITGSSTTKLALIAFSSEDTEGVRYPHCDALVVTVKIANRTVKRVLVDHGNSTDIVHWDIVERLGYKVEQLQATWYCIRGISGHRTKPLGQLDLPVRFDIRPRTRTLWITFQVINIPFPFNVLLGRPTIYELRAVSSVYCMKVKFPTNNGEWEMKAN
ncbi:hypothetical protein ACOSQ2_026421 [Xanthoceras sorbifolium]